MSTPDEILAKMLVEANKIHTIELDIYGEILTLSYRKLHWKKTSKAMSYAMEYNQDPTDKTKVVGTFRLDTYYVYALREMIVNPPFPLTDTVFDAIPQEAGEKLQALMPNPLSAGATAEKVDSSQKELGESSEEIVRQ